MRMVMLLCSLCFSAWVPISAATEIATATAPSTPALSSYFQELWTSRDGLPHNTINGIVQTPDGYLWLATWEGLVRFNGAEFKVYDLYSDIGLADAGVQNVTVTDAGELVVVGARGTFVMRKQDAQGRYYWQNYEVPSTLINKAVANPDDTIWLATEEFGLLKQQANGQVEPYLETRGSRAMHAYDILRKDQTQLFVASDRGLISVTKDAVTYLNQQHGLPESSIFAVTQYQGKVVVASEQGVFIGDGNTFAPLHPQLLNKNVIRLYTDSSANLWLGTINDGLYRLSSRGLEHLSTDNSLPNARVISIYEDHERSIWVGTNGGMVRLRDTPFETFTQANGIADNFVRTLIQHSDGSIWVGSAGGLNRFEQGQWQSFNDDFTHHSILSLYEHPEYGVFIGSYTHGLGLWRDGKIQQVWTRDDGLLANEIRAITGTHDGYVWIATPNGINRYHPTTGIEVAPQADQARFSVSLYQDQQQRLWLGTARGLFVLSDDRFEKVDLSAFNQAEYVFDIFPYQDHLWFATDRGLIIYDPASQTGQVVGRKHGLSVEKIFQVTVDPYDNVWMSSNRGIMRTSLNSILALTATDQAPQPLVLDTFREADGLVSSQANGGSNPALLLDDEGHVWVPTAYGVAVIDPAQLGRFHEYAPPSAIEEVVINGNSLSDTVSLAEFDGNRISIHYAGLGFSMNNQIRYRTQLIGYEQQPRHTQATFAEFTNLPPGTYEFVVTAYYGNSDLQGTAATFDFSVPPKLYQRASFWIALAVLIALSLWLFVRMRIKVLQNRAQRLEQQVAEKTQALQQQAQRFAHLAQYDELTELPNRRSFNRDFEAAVATAQQHQLPLSLAVIDIDHFKTINDTYSHAVGDQILRWIAKLMQQELRSGDKIARWGGEEFTLLMTQTEAAAALDIAERLRQSIAAATPPADLIDRSITISIGLATYSPEQAELSSASSLLIQADQALYQAKAAGRNCVKTYQPPAH
ncbi:diguanylate cyclase (GGDEF)-like protein [Pseudidiomarina tainanensis]|uniref:diguanylate cyclase n=4 Tax=Idiomarinaceae TaxID=267893 RepID=A0A368USU5_9GAMM|nr:diguanylate cyclase (GGDEF)-like protein [Pseudidiomarina maritima]RBP89327.1 diguanylate cyclase (GGDEF)-like protein [Pseudidiomarina tainanensis]RCW31175.1 diguanylate cyclase (GGDEF)-like protein [Pseudidiomarina tainanensis]